MKTRTMREREPERLVQHANFSLGGWGSGLHHLGCIIMTPDSRGGRKGGDRGRNFIASSERPSYPVQLRVLKLGVHNSFILTAVTACGMFPRFSGHGCFALQTS